MRTKEVSKCTVISERNILVKVETINGFPTLADSFGIRSLGFKCNWWRQANDAVASEPRIFRENHHYKSFSMSR